MKENKWLLLLEEFKQSPQYRIGKVLQTLLLRVKEWFEKGAFSKQDVRLSYCERSDTDKGLQNTMRVRFHDKENHYTLTGTIMTEDAVEGEPASVHLQLKRYQTKSAELMNTYEADVSPSDFTEDWAINAVAEVDKEKSLDLKPTDAPLDTQPGSSPDDAQASQDGSEDGEDPLAQPSDEEKNQDALEG